MQLNNTAINQRNFNCLKKLNSIDSNVIICFFLTPYYDPTSQTLLPSPLNLQYFTTPNKSLMSVCCVCVEI